MEFMMKPIGVIHTPFNDKSQTPIQSTRSQATGRVEIFPEFTGALEDLGEFSHIILLYAFHCSTSYSLKVKPFLDDQLRGLFARRYPCRPNPIVLSIVRLLARRCWTSSLMYPNLICAMMSKPVGMPGGAKNNQE
jgi:tRNA-Thr(GGU) m(6)t(6)A37 methyltransferase TsaA